jgi:hypothetical protein
MVHWELAGIAWGSVRQLSTLAVTDSGCLDFPNRCTTGDAESTNTWRLTCVSGGPAVISQTPSRNFRCWRKGAPVANGFGESETRTAPTLQSWETSL